MLTIFIENSKIKPINIPTSIEKNNLYKNRSLGHGPVFSLSQNNSTQSPFILYTNKIPTLFYYLTPPTNSFPPIYQHDRPSQLKSCSLLPKMLS